MKRTNNIKKVNNINSNRLLFILLLLILLELLAIKPLFASTGGVEILQYYKIEFNGIVVNIIDNNKKITTTKIIKPNLVDSVGVIKINDNIITIDNEVLNFHYSDTNENILELSNGAKIELFYDCNGELLNMLYITKIKSLRYIFKSKHN